jgi:hypothetical protein
MIPRRSLVRRSEPEFMIRVNVTFVVCDGLCTPLSQFYADVYSMFTVRWRNRSQCETAVRKCEASVRVMMTKDG